MEERLYSWFLNKRAQNIPVNGEMLKIKAIEIFKNIHGPDIVFTASQGWLQNFKSSCIRCTVTLPLAFNMSRKVTLFEKWNRSGFLLFHLSRLYCNNIKKN